MGFVLSINDYLTILVLKKLAFYQIVEYGILHQRDRIISLEELA